MSADMQAPPAREWLSQEEAAAHLGVTVRTVQRLAAMGHIRGHKPHVGGVRYRRAHLDEYMERCPPRRRRRRAKG